MVAFGVNLATNKVIQTAEGVMAVLKIGGLALFAVVGLWYLEPANFTNGADVTSPASIDGFLAAVAIAIHWGILRHLRNRITVIPAIVAVAIVLDVVALGALAWVKADSDPLVLWVSAAGIAVIWVGERLFMRSHTRADGTMDM